MAVQDLTIPNRARRLLDFIQNIEAPRGYDTVYGNNQNKLPKKLTSMTIAEVQSAQPAWSKRFGSSASGGLQFMVFTLKRLVEKHQLDTRQKFSKELQLWLGYKLLQERGIERYWSGSLSRDQFGNNLSKEWASLPVLSNIKGQKRQVTRGQSYYAGDGINKSLVKPEAVEKILTEITKKSSISKAIIAVEDTKTSTKVVTGVATSAGVVGTVVAGSVEAQDTLSQITPITDIVSTIGYYGPAIAGTVVGIVVLVVLGIVIFKWAKS